MRWHMDAQISIAKSFPTQQITDETCHPHPDGSVIGQPIDLVVAIGDDPAVFAVSPVFPVRFT